MTIRTVAVLLPAALLLAPGALSQSQFSVTITPNPAPPGATIVVTATAAAGSNLFTPFGCLVNGVFDAPGGNLVAPSPCTFLGLTVPPCGSTSPLMWQWNQNTTSGAAVPGTTYWFDIQYVVGGPFGPTTSEWYCVTIDDPANPVPALTAANTPVAGSQFMMTLDSPNDAGATYIAAISGTSNTGQTVLPGVTSCLDADALFAVSFPAQPSLFSNFNGNLDASGNATLGINIPPGLSCLQAHVQALIFGATGFRVSNDLTATVP